MTTSYKLDAIKELRKAKKEERAKEAEELIAKKSQEAKDHAANMERIAKKMKRIEQGYDGNGSPTSEEPKKTVKKAAKKAPAKKAPAKKKGRPAGSKKKKK